MMRVLQIVKGSLYESEPHDTIKARCQEGAVTWIDLVEGTDDDWKLVLDLYPFHQLAVDDCRSNAQRPKLEEYPGHLLLVFQALALREDSLDTVELDFLITNGMLVTVRDAHVTSVEEVWNKCLRNPAMFAGGADSLLHAVLDRTVDHYFPITEALELRLDEIETGISDHPDPATFERIYALKKQLLGFRRFVAPQTDIVNALSFRPLVGVRHELHIYFRDIHDHLIRIHDRLEIMRDMTTGVLDSYMTQMSQRTNEIVKTLTMLGAIMLPLTFLTGVFGMNFEAIPGLHHPLGFWVALGLMVVLAGSVFIFFRQRRWF